jgi:lipopolysaccharide/colanic/teichoic acid biosynthesis glycosyltransferase
VTKEALNKRIFDIFLSTLGLFFSAPFWFIIAILTLLEDGRPIFYLQDRVGKDGRIFKGVKFRSMVLEAEKNFGPVQAQEHDGRITKLGRILRVSAMDELPQLWNIVKGDMSFVGPRALRPFEVDSEDGKVRSIWEFEGAKERSSVRPGLTGIAQILAPRDIPRSEKFKYDIWYIKKRNFWLDVRIIILSFFITFMGKWEIREERFKVLTSRLNSQIGKDKS